MKRRSSNRIGVFCIRNDAYVDVISFAFLDFKPLYLYKYGVNICKYETMSLYSVRRSDFINNTLSVIGALSTVRQPKKLGILDFNFQNKF